MRIDSNLFHIGHDSSKLGVSLHLPFIHRVVGVKKKGVREWKGGNGGGNSNEESVGVGNENDGTLVANGVLIADGGKSSPLLKVEHLIGIGEVTVSLVVGAGAHNDPAEHGVTAIPDFGLDGGSPSPLGELGVLLTPVLYSVVEDRASDGSGGPFR
jgi:hypothetical protein